MPHKRKKAKVESPQLENNKPNTKLNPPDIYDINVSTPSPEIQSLPQYIPEFIPGLSNEATTITTTSTITTATTTSTYTISSYHPLTSSGVVDPTEETIDDNNRYFEYTVPPDSPTETSSESYSTSDEEPDSGDPSPHPSPILSPPQSISPAQKRNSPVPNTQTKKSVQPLTIPSIYIYTSKPKETIALIKASVKPSPLFKVRANILECFPQCPRTQVSTLKLLLANTIEHHTLNIKHNRPAKVAIKYIPLEITQSEISAELVANDLIFFSISRIMQTRNGKKHPSNILIISTLPEVVPRYKKLRALCDILVTVEDYIRKDIPQCHRCQGFGHSSALCQRAHKCVKCGQAHAGVPCEAVECKCANCGSGHPASYRGCQAYLETKARYDARNSTNSSLSTSFNPQTPSTLYSPSISNNTTTPNGIHSIATNTRRTTSPSSTPPPPQALPPPSIQTTSPQPDNMVSNFIQTIIELLRSFNIPQILQTFKTTIIKINSASNFIDKLIILLETISSFLT